MNAGGIKPDPVPEAEPVHPFRNSWTRQYDDARTRRGSDAVHGHQHPEAAHGDLHDLPRIDVKLVVSDAGVPAELVPHPGDRFVTYDGWKRYARHALTDGILRLDHVLTVRAGR